MPASVSSSSAPALRLRIPWAAALSRHETHEVVEPQTEQPQQRGELQPDRDGVRTAEGTPQEELEAREHAERDDRGAEGAGAVAEVSRYASERQYRDPREEQQNGKPHRPRGEQLVEMLQVVALRSCHQ